MKQYILYTIGFIFSINTFAQTSPKDFIGADTDLTVRFVPAEINEKTVEFKTADQTSGELRYSHIPTSYTVDTSKDIGQIDVQANTAPNGSLQVTIPVNSYTSPRGMTPEIAINYNSNAGNGPLGMGWNLTGISEITRIDKTYYHDYVTEAANAWDNNCAFALDGIRLIRQNETSTLIDYQTEQGLIKVTGYLSPDGKISHFDAYFPDGQVCSYGWDFNYGGQLNYPVREMKDKTGNKMNYEYDILDTHYRIKKITYGTQGEASIVFGYTDNRTEVIRHYRGGLEILYDYLLKTIASKYNDTVLKTYTLNHVTKGYVSAIDKVECQSGSNSLNPVIFYYGDNQQEKVFQCDSVSLNTGGYNIQNPSAFRATKGKFDYFSDDDGLIILPNKLNYYHYNRSGSIGGHSNNEIRNAYESNDRIYINNELSNPVVAGGIITETGEGFIDIFCMDLLDDTGSEEIIKVNNTLNGSAETLSFDVYSAYYMAPIEKRFTREYTFDTRIKDNNDTYSIHPKYYFTGDFTGTGRMQVMAVSTYNPMGRGTEFTSKSYLFNLLSGRDVTVMETPFQYNVVFPKSGDDILSGEDAYNQSDKLYTLDFDGDGKTDFCLINNEGTFIYTLDTSGSLTNWKLLASYPYLKNSDLKDRDLFMGEFNGDGKTDLLLSPSNIGEYSWTIYTSSGSGEGMVFSTSTINLASKISSARYMLQDMNGDGMTDFLEISGERENSRLMVYFISDRVLRGTQYTPIEENTVAVPANIQSRKSFSSLVSYRGNVVDKISYKNNDSKNSQLTGIVNSMGVITKIEYDELNSSSLFYSNGSGAIFPFSNFTGNYTAVSKTETYMNNEKLKDIGYSYSNGIIHKQGLGFCGFESIRSYDFITANYKNEVYDPNNFSIIKELDTRDFKEAYSHTSPARGSKARDIWINHKTSIDKLTGVTVSSMYEHDAYGNVTKETVRYSDGISSQIISNSYHNIEEENNYIIGLPRETEIMNIRNNSFVKTKTARVYNEKYLPASTTNYYNGNRLSQQTFEYDDNLNISVSKTRQYNSPDWLTTGFVYDSYGRVIQETDPLGLTTDYIYNQKGELESVSDHKNNTVTYQYDVWGKKIQTVYPDGIIENYVVDWVSSPSNALIRNTIRTTGAPDIHSYSDALGRQIRTSEQRFDGTFLHTDVVYNIKGLVEKTSLPFKGTQASYWNINNYDIYGRLVSIEYASGKIDTYSYDKLKTTSVSDSIITMQYTDATGNVVKVADPAGSITYNYNPDGQIKSIVAPGKVTTTFSYDEYGRQTQIDDPSAGLKTIGYDASGNVNIETDARGMVTKSVYDEFNRLTEREVAGEFTHTYTYTGDGLLAEETNTNGTSRVYSYDELLRPVTVKENIVDGKFLQKTVGYLNGKVVSTDYSTQDGSVITKNYNYQNGHMVEIRLGNQSVWQLTEENDMGMPVKVNTGSLARTYGFDTFGMPISRTVKSGDTVIQDFEYGFNHKTGNLNCRKDNIRNMREDFGYDHLNRLTHFAGREITYNSKGNIIDYPDVGQFRYDQDKPYQLSVLGMYGDDVPLRTQEITYNGMLLPETISENGCMATLNYNGDGSRIKMQLARGGQAELTRYYIAGQYEIDITTSGTTERLYPSGSSYSTPVVLIKDETGEWKVNFICRDYLGSITHITDYSGNLLQELSYDAWGRMRNAGTHVLFAVGEEPELLLGRGYTGHEHLNMFGLINMNARLYDPVIGRFLSPDPEVQFPFSTQNMNRYIYAMNNPLKYTDPNGEFAIIPILIVAGAAMVGGYVTYGVVTGNWGFKAVTTGLSSGAFATIGFLTMGGSAAISPWVFAGKDAANMILSQIIQPIDIPLNKIGLSNTSISISPVALFTAGAGTSPLQSGFKYGAGLSVSQKVGDWTITGGLSTDGKSVSNIFGGASYDDGTQGFSYYYSYYNNKPKQPTGIGSYRHKKFSVRWENDLFAKSGDKFRSNATEVGMGGYILGTNVFTTEDQAEEAGSSPSKFVGKQLVRIIKGMAQSNVHPDGKTESSPLYIGKKSGNSITRIGFNNPIFGDLFQNGMHWIVNSPYFHRGEFSSPYIQKGTYKPYSMY